MTVIFDYEEAAVYVENPDPKAEDPKIYYFKHEGENKQQGQATVSLMRKMYNLGQDHRSKEIRKALGV
jgi:hypothetical protein